MQAVPIVPSNARSDRLVITKVPVGHKEQRTWYLRHKETCEPIWISCSDFVPEEMVQHLMQDKKPRAIAVKWAGGTDRITNMEGALHTFVTPLAYGYIHGDYQWFHGHSISVFPAVDKVQSARLVIFSGLVHLDFEVEQVMWDLVSNDDLDALLSAPGERNIGMPISREDIADKYARERFEDRLRKKTRLQLLKGADISRFVASFANISGNHITVEKACVILKQAVNATDSATILESIQDKWLYVSRSHHGSQSAQKNRLSLYLMFLSMLHQVRNEHAGLETICSVKHKRPGYVYTYDPPSIFVQALGHNGSDLMLFIYAAALRYLSLQKNYPSMRILAYNDFNHSGAISLLKQALRRWDCEVMSKSDLFSGPDGDLYQPGQVGEGCMLVIHNNSDGFGNNIETEQGRGSMDAVIGSHSNMAACLKRDGQALYTKERSMRWPHRGFVYHDFT